MEHISLIYSFYKHLNKPKHTIDFSKLKWHLSVVPSQTLKAVEFLDHTPRLLPLNKGHNNVDISTGPHTVPCRYRGCDSRNIIGIKVLPRIPDQRRKNMTQI